MYLIGVLDLMLDVPAEAGCRRLEIAMTVTNNTPTRRIASVSVAFASFIGLSGPVLAVGEVITVTTVADVMDFVMPQQVGDLPGPDGRVSFHEALAAVNNTPGPQTIAFAIPQSEWWLVPNMAILEQENGIFALYDDDTTVDFTTQTAFTGDTNPDGNEVGIYGLEPNAWGVASIWIFGDNCTIKGLDKVWMRGYAVRIQGNNNRVIGCHTDGGLYAAVYITGGSGGPTPTGNIIGGTEPGEANWLTAGNCGVRIDGPADGNIVIGNFITGVSGGVQVRSATSVPNMIATNNRIGGPTPAERNVIAGVGYFGEEGFPSGAMVSLEWAVNTIVEGNYMGTTPDGNAAYPNQRAPGGVVMTNSPGSIVRNNLISGIAVTGVNHYAGQRFGTGVSVQGNCNGSVIQTNRIGTNAAGTAAVPNHKGVEFGFWPGTQPGNVTVGGSKSGLGNLIAFNETTGVIVQAVMSKARITGNSIRANSGLGIDLYAFGSLPGAAGVSPNDNLDADGGGNNLQNFPVITAASSSSAGTHITGTLHSAANTAFTIELFSSAACDPSGFGEGEVFLGAVGASTDASGNATFDTLVSTIEQAGRVITATAADALGNTSEFSACATVSSTVVAGDANGDGEVNADDLVAVILAWGACPAPPAACPADLNHDGDVDADDLTIVILNWS
jgi:hypothetical protein